MRHLHIGTYSTRSCTNITIRRYAIPLLRSRRTQVQRLSIGPRYEFVGGQQYDLGNLDFDRTERIALSGNALLQGTLWLSM